MNRFPLNVTMSRMSQRHRDVPACGSVNRDICFIEMKPRNSVRVWLATSSPCCINVLLLTLNIRQNIHRLKALNRTDQRIRTLWTFIYLKCPTTWKSKSGYQHLRGRDRANVSKILTLLTYSNRKWLNPERYTFLIHKIQIIFQIRTRFHHQMPDFIKFASLNFKL